MKQRGRERARIGLGYMHNNFERGFMGQPREKFKFPRGGGRDGNLMLRYRGTGWDYRSAALLHCRYLGYNCSRVMQQRRVTGTRVLYTR